MATKKFDDMTDKARALEAQAKKLRREAQAAMAAQAEKESAAEESEGMEPETAFVTAESEIGALESESPATVAEPAQDSTAGPPYDVYALGESDVVQMAGDLQRAHINRCREDGESFTGERYEQLMEAERHPEEQLAKLRGEVDSARREFYASKEARDALNHPYPNLKAAEKALADEDEREAKALRRRMQEREDKAVRRVDGRDVDCLGDRSLEALLRQLDAAGKVAVLDGVADCVLGAGTCQCDRLLCDSLYVLHAVARHRLRFRLALSHDFAHSLVLLSPSGPSFLHGGDRRRRRPFDMQTRLRYRKRPLKGLGAGVWGRCGVRRFSASAHK